MYMNLFYLYLHQIGGRMKYQKSWEIALIVLVCVLLNFVGKVFSMHFGIPLYLDTFGTIIVSYLYGPLCGAMVGGSVSFLYGVTTISNYTFYFSIVNAVIGYTIGIFAGKRYFDHFFGAFTLSAIVTAVGTAVAVPVNIFFNHFMTGNRWGDGVILFLRENGINRFLSCLVGEFFVTFPDSVLTIMLFFYLLRLYHRKGESSGKHPTHTPIAFLLVIGLGLSVATPAFAAKSASGSAGSSEHFDNKYKEYTQTVYDGTNGIPGCTVNDIASTRDGVLWIGSYGGLYRYNGNEFQWMDQYDSVKNANCFYVDRQGRLWIGTNDRGVSIMIHEKITNVLDTTGGLPNDSIQSMTSDTQGNYYIGTSDSVAIVRLNSKIRIKGRLDSIKYASSMSPDNQGRVAIVGDDGALFLVQGDKILSSISDRKDGALYNSAYFDDQGRLYAGMSDNRIIVYSTKGDHLKEKRQIHCNGLSNIQSIQKKDGVLFICSDTGVGYIGDDKAFYKINTNEFNNSIDNMEVDYQGNVWFTSSRQGLLKLSQSSFTELFDATGLDPAVVNTEIRWKSRMYFGTDEGLKILDDRDRPVTKDPLISLLRDIRIRSLHTDSSNNLWICTSGSGLYCIDRDNTVHHYTSRDGVLGDKMRTIVELSDNTIVACGDGGITYIRQGKVIDTVGRAEGILNTKVLCLLTTGDDSILAGTDGGGVFLLSPDHRVVRSYDRSNSSISSGVVMRIVKDVTNSGYYIVSGNGLNYIDAKGNLRPLEKFPYYNVFDVIDTGNGKLFVPCSAGIYVVDKTPLLKGQSIDYELLDYRNGLRGSLTSNAWNYLDWTGSLYLACGNGCSRVNLSRYTSTSSSYRMIIRNMVVDGKQQPIDHNNINKIDRSVRRLEIQPEIINFSVKAPYVSYYLEGFEKKPTVVRQNELGSVVYTNLPVGTYTFHLSVLDNNASRVIEESIYRFEKPKEIYDNWWFYLYMGTVLAMFIIWLTWFISRMQMRRTIAFQEKELALARKQIRMGNETILAIAKTVDAKDPNTSQHSKRVSEYSVQIAKRLGFSEEKQEQLRKAALLHDIGKIGIPDAVLNKPGKLTDEEYAKMKSHVTAGAEILKDFTLVENVAEGALYHHERYDGKGYVHGLKGEEIPLNARIIGLADAFDAMTANRVYRKRLPFDYVLEELKKGRGTQFDPHLVDIFLELIEDGSIPVRKEENQ